MAKTEIIEESSTVEKTPAVEESKSRSKLNPAIIVLIALVVLFIIPATAYLLITGKRVLITDKQVATVEETCECEECKQEECAVSKESEECDCAVQQVKLSNTDWAMITVPSLKFSMEVPNSDPVKNMFQDVELVSSWNFNYIREMEYPTEGLGTFVGAVRGSFRPTSDSPETACGGDGCANISIVFVDVYNNGKKTQAQVFEAYKATFNNDDGTDLQSKQATKWGFPVYEYSASYPGGSDNGYLFVKNGLTYKISYYAASQPTYMKSEVNKIVDSIKFN